MSEKTIEQKLDFLIHEIESIKAGLIAKGYLEDDRTDQDIYKKAKETVREVGKASTSLLQRKLKIGYAHAARLMDELEGEGVIGPGKGATSRKVL